MINASRNDYRAKRILALELKSSQPCFSYSILSELDADYRQPLRGSWHRPLPPHRQFPLHNRAKP
jgi:hypothetical protein